MAGSVEDVREIIDLTLTYAWSIDTKQFDGLDDVFTPDASGVFHNVECADREAIKARIMRGVGKFELTQHITTNQQVRVDGDTATCRSQLQSQHIAGDHQFIVGGYYLDDLVRTETGWRIRHRIMQATWQSGSRP